MRAKRQINKKNFSHFKSNKIIEIMKSGFRTSIAQYFAYSVAYIKIYINQISFFDYFNLDYFPAKRFFIRLRKLNIQVKLLTKFDLTETPENVLLVQ